MKEAKEAKQKKRNHKVAAYVFALFKDVRVVRLFRHDVNTMPQNILLDVLSCRQCREHSRSNLCFLHHDLIGLYFARILCFKYAGILQHSHARTQSHTHTSRYTHTDVLILIYIERAAKNFGLDLLLVCKIRGGYCTAFFRTDGCILSPDSYTKLSVKHHDPCCMLSDDHTRHLTYSK